VSAASCANVQLTEEVALAYCRTCYMYGAPTKFFFFIFFYFFSSEFGYRKSSQCCSAGLNLETGATKSENLDYKCSRAITA
jgi:hypothetical protein